MPSFRKIVGVISEIDSLDPKIHTDKGDITEPVTFAGSIIRLSEINSPADIDTWFKMFKERQEIIY